MQTRGNASPAHQDAHRSGFERYAERGYVWPLRAFPAGEAEAARGQFMTHSNRNIHRFEGSLPRERIWLTIDTHLALPWLIISRFRWPMWRGRCRPATGAR